MWMSSLLCLRRIVSLSLLSALCSPALAADALTLTIKIEGLRNDKGLVRVALFHGSMPRDERLKVLEDFRRRRADVLVATHVVEGGAPIPAARAWVIEQADKMTPQRLHRVWCQARSAKAAADVIAVVGDEPDAEGLSWVEAMPSLLTGFDLGARLLSQGTLDHLVGERAGLLPQWTWINPKKDRELLFDVRPRTHRLLQQDPMLRAGANAEISRLLRARWDSWWSDDALPCPVPENRTDGPKRRRRRRRRR